MKIFLFIVIALNFSICYAKSTKQDSLWKVWRDPSQPDTNRLKAMYRLCWDNHIVNQPDSALFYADKIYDFAQKIQSYKYMGNALNIKGVVCYNKGNYSEALDKYRKVLSYFEKGGDKQGVASAMANIGLVYSDQGNYSEALKHYSKSLKIREQLGDKKGIAIVFSNIGSIFSRQKEFNKALDYHKKAFELRREINFKDGMAASLNNIGNVYFGLKEYNTAIEYYNQSLLVYKEIGKLTGIAFSLNNIAGVYKEQKKYTEALDYYNKSLKIKEELNDNVAMIPNLINIGDIYFEQEKLIMAQEYAKKALQLVENINSLIYKEPTLRLMWKINKKLGNHKVALEMYELYIDTRDTLVSEKNQRAMLQQEYQYNYEKKFIADSLTFSKQKEIDEQKHQISLAKEVQRKNILYGGVIFLLLFGVFIFISYRRKTNDNLLITAQKSEVETQKQIIELKHKEITDSINYAERIQRSFLASKDLLDANLKNYFLFFKPKDVVSGDFYWANSIDDKLQSKFILCTADSTGHGVPGAIMSLLNITSLEAAINEGYIKPNEILNETRKTIINRLKNDGSAEGGKDGMDCSVCVFDFNSMRLQVAASNNPVFVVRRGENDSTNLIEIKGDKMPVGRHENQHHSFTLHEFDIQKDDVVYTLTDGFSDQFGGNRGKKYMIKNLKRFLIEMSHLPMQEQYKELENELKNWKGINQQVDDICIIGIRV